MPAANRVFYASWAGRKSNQQFANPSCGLGMTITFQLWFLTSTK